MRRCPCETCGNAQKKSCNYKVCGKFRRWFAKVWAEIRMAAKELEG